MKIQHDARLEIARGSSRHTAKWQNQKTTWGELLDQLGDTTRTRETVAEYAKLSKTKQDEIKDVGGFVGGWLKQGRRKADSLECRSMLTLDADFATADLLDSFDLAYGCAACVYSTHKHTPEKPRLRLIVPLTRTLSGDEYQAAARMLANDLGMDLFDDTTYQPTRLMYWPSTSADGQYIFDFIDAPLLDPDTLLARYPDWRDTSYWPESSRAVQQRKRHAAKQGDPTTKPGMIGAFCRAYTVDDAIAAFLPDRYEPCALEGRYTYTGGSTAAGLVVYDDGKFAYSNHATDPASGRLCNAFDLVRLHLFGEQDADTDEDTPVNRLPSFKAMSDLARGDAAVKAVLGRERAARAREDFDIPEDEGGADDWAQQLELDPRGQPAQTINNAVLILTNDPALRGALAYNAFRGCNVVLRELPWRKVTVGEKWTDTDDSELRRYIEMVYQITGKDRIFDAVAIAARRGTFHPVREYLAGLTWDGVPRLDTLLVDYLGAEDCPYTRAVTRKALAGAVARVMRPGCKFDYVLTIMGQQGRGKSTLAAKLGRGWYTDTVHGIGSKEAYEDIQGFWIVELAELAATKKVEIEAIKLFISKQVDTYRAAYGRRAEDHPRQCIFIGTTNSKTFLRDDTGNRRFWPVRLCEAPPPKTVFDDLTDDVIGQIWAEAVVRYNDGEPLMLTPELEAIAREQQADFTEDDPRAGEIQSYLDTLLPEDWESKDKADRRYWISDTTAAGKGVKLRQRVCVAEIWQECLNGNPTGLNRQIANELLSVMRKMPGWRENERKLRCGIYGVQRCFDRVADKR